MLINGLFDHADARSTESQSRLQHTSVEEYLRTEERSPVKREYVGGRVYPLHGATADEAGTTAAHNLIGLNILATLHPAARRAGARLHAFDLKLFIPQSQSFYYPDVMWVDAAVAPDPNAPFIRDPTLLVEVISDNSVERDRVAKFAAYTALPSLQTYLIVEQRERRVSAFNRHGEQWTQAEVTGGGRVDVPCLGGQVSLDEIYADVLQ